MKKVLGLITYTFLNSLVIAKDLNYPFPIEHYNQNIDSWINPSSPEYDKPLTTKAYQYSHLQEFYRHYYSAKDNDFSPWSKNFVNSQLDQPNGVNIVFLESQIITGFYQHDGKEDKAAYMLNYRPYTLSQFQKIADNMGFNDQMKFEYNPVNRAIAIDNLELRSLPTSEPLFYNPNIAGEGYPFDNLQETAIFVGMPLYIVKQSVDQVWSLVITSDAIGWVKTNAIAKVNEQFISKWLKAAKYGIVGITKQQSLLDKENINYGIAYNGNTLPLVSEANNEYQVLIPILGNHGLASTTIVHLTKDSAAKMPLQLTPHNMISIIKNQIGKLYGWGNYLFNYDCSAETKALFTPFGYYLPRNSQAQYKAAEKVVILDKLNAKQRQNYLIKNGHKFMTLIQIPGHIMLYLGNYPNPNSPEHEQMPLTYQNIWGLKTPENNSRAIIGSSVLLPLLLSYPEDPTLISFYDDKYRSKFRLLYLDVESQ